MIKRKTSCFFSYWGSVTGGKRERNANCFETRSTESALWKWNKWKKLPLVSGKKKQTNENTTQTNEITVLRFSQTLNAIKVNVNSEVHRNEEWNIATVYG